MITCVVCRSYHSFIHKVLKSNISKNKLNMFESKVWNDTSKCIGTAWWPYWYVSVDFCIDSVPIVTVSSQPKFWLTVNTLWSWMRSLCCSFIQYSVYITFYQNIDRFYGACTAPSQWQEQMFRHCMVPGEIELLYAICWLIEGKETIQSLTCTSTHQTGSEHFCQKN